MPAKRPLGRLRRRATVPGTPPTALPAPPLPPEMTRTRARNSRMSMKIAGQDTRLDLARDFSMIRRGCQDTSGPAQTCQDARPFLLDTFWCGGAKVQTVR